MGAKLTRLAVALAAMWVVACGGSETQGPPAQAERLEPGVAARVAGDPIAVQTVQAIAQAQGIRLEQARERAVDDALFAAWAKDRFAGWGLVATVQRAVLARGLLEQLRRRVRQRGPPTRAERDRVLKEHWAQLNRPPAVRTTHAVVVPQKPGQRDAARRLADRIAGAVQGISEPKRFIEAARQVPSGELQVRAESLAPVTADGRVVPDGPPGGSAEAPRYDEQFARAAHAIERVGGQSPVVESDFGFHVILLEERLAARRAPPSELRRRIADRVYERRARQLQERILQQQAQRHSVEVRRAAAELTAEVGVAP